MTRTILILVIAVAFVAGTIVTGTTAEAANEKTLQTECAKKQGTIQAFLCEAIFELQQTIEDLTFIQTDPAESVVEIQLAPAATAPPIIITDNAGNDLFTVLPDGTLQIGTATSTLTSFSLITPLVTTDTLATTSASANSFTVGTLTVTGTSSLGTASASSFSGNGAGLTNLDPTKLSSGTAGISITGNAATATSATTATTATSATNADTASALATGTYDKTYSFTGVNTFSNTGNSFSGDGSGLMSLNADNLVTGTVPNARLSGTYGSALTLSNAANSFTGDGSGLTGVSTGDLAAGTYGNALTFSNAANSFTGDGSGLTGVSTGDLAAGTYGNALTFTNPANSFSGLSVTGTLQTSLGPTTLIPTDGVLTIPLDGNVFFVSGIPPQFQDEISRISSEASSGTMFILIMLEQHVFLGCNPCSASGENIITISGGSGPITVVSFVKAGDFWYEVSRAENLPAP